MALIADSGGIYGLYDTSEEKHRAIKKAFEAESGQVLIPTLVLCEIDYLLRSRIGIRAELDFIDSIRSGVFTMEPCTHEDLARSAILIERYQQLDLGLADACVVACAERMNIHRILTVDERHFQ